MDPQGGKKMKNHKLLMIPGPTPVVRSIQDQMGRETIAFGDKAFVQDFREVLADLNELWHCDGKVFVVAATGTFAMEMALSNSIKAGDNLLIVSNGFFGDRFKEIADRKGYKYDVLTAPWGDSVSAEDIEKKLSEKHYDAITVTHVDTSTGVCAPVGAIGEVMKKFPETIYILDGVCSAAGEELYLDKHNVDVFFTGSQKAFGVAPGLAILWANKRSLERRESLGVISEYYCDYKKWEPIMDDTGKYFATPAVNLIWALQESLRIIKEEGIENRYARHKKNAEAFQAALEAMDLMPLAKKELRAATLSNPLYPEGIDDVAFRTKLEERGVQVAGGLAAYAGKMFRIGHMGNADEHDLLSALGDIEKVLYELKDGYEIGRGVTTFLKVLMG